MKRDDGMRRDIGRRLALERRQAGLTQAKAAAGLGLANSSLSMIERGRRRIDAARLARATNAPATWMRASG